MIKHVIMWKMEDYADGRDKAANIDIALSRLRALKEELPIIRSFEAGINEKPGDMAYDVCIMMDFDSWGDLDYYLNYPAHKKISEFVKSVRKSRTSVDYEY